MMEVKPMKRPRVIKRKRAGPGRPELIVYSLWIFFTIIMKKYNLKKLLSEAKNRKERRLIIFFMVKLGLSKLSPLEKASLAKHIVEKMTGNANFTTPSPTLVSLDAAADAV